MISADRVSLVTWWRVAVEASDEPGGANGSKVRLVSCRGQETAKHARLDDPRALGLPVEVRRLEVGRLAGLGVAASPEEALALAQEHLEAALAAVVAQLGILRARGVGVAELIRVMARDRARNGGEGTVAPADGPEAEDPPADRDVKPDNLLELPPAETSFAPPSPSA